MDQDKLGKLRARYAGASGGDIHDLDGLRSMGSALTAR